MDKTSHTIAYPEVKNAFAPTPPMGWNSYDFFDTTVTEADVLANAAALQEKLLPYGWHYVVVDIQWYANRPNARREEYQYLPFGNLAMDQYGRLLPDPERFPSSAGGKGFQLLADQLHAMGLKFGIHIMRGIPRIAAHNRTPVLGTDTTADEIADPSSICLWNPDMYGVRDCPAGQAYYDSLLKLYAEWGVDYIKVDDICNTDNQIPGSPRAYHGRHEIEMLHTAILNCGRPIVLSLSPGPALIDKAWHYRQYANLWRITDDMWDNWRDLKHMFARCELWQGQGSAGCYPDCDMLPLGRIGRGFGAERDTNLTKEEQRTMMSLWCLFGSPLMLGADLTQLDEWTLSLLQNESVLNLLHPQRVRRQVLRTDSCAVWTSMSPLGGSLCVGIFNLGDGQQVISIPQEMLGIPGTPVCRDLWSGKLCATPQDTINAFLEPHDCDLLEFTLEE